MLRSFNDVFLRAFEIKSDESKLPLILFFKIADGEVKDIVIVELEQHNLLFAFDELYTIIQDYIDQLKEASAPMIKTKTNKLTKIVSSVKKVMVEKFVELLMVKGGEFGSNYFN